MKFAPDYVEAPGGTMLDERPAWKILWAEKAGLNVLVNFGPDRRRRLILVCPNCGCLFWPDDDGEVVFPDRHAQIGDDGQPVLCTPGDGECGCHAVPHRIEAS